MLYRQQLLENKYLITTVYFFLLSRQRLGYSDPFCPKTSRRFFTRYILPAGEKQPHSIMLLPANCSFCLPSDFPRLPLVASGLKSIDLLQVELTITCQHQSCTQRLKHTQNLTFGPLSDRCL